MNAAGTVTDTYSYTAFGELFNQTGSTANSYLYTGQQFDSLTGLYDLRARYYDPAMGRFLSQDIYPINFGNPVELNRYVYTENNPINLIDPSGYSPSTDYSIILGALRGAASGAVLGALGGAVFGVIFSLACGGDPRQAALYGALYGAMGGAVIGAAGAAGLPWWLAPGITTAFGAAGIYVTARDAGRVSFWCSFVSGVASVATFATGFASGFSGGTPPAFQPCYATCGGGSVSASAVQGAITSPTILGGMGAASMMLGGRSGNEEVPPEVEKYLKRLPKTGSRIKVSPDEISYKLLAELMYYSGGVDEFGLYEMKNGDTILLRGGVTIKPIPGIVKTIVHSHPGSKPYAAGFDFTFLKTLNQASSYIITESGDLIEYFINGDYFNRGKLW